MRIAVVTPVGPGHEETVDRCRNSIAVAAGSIAFPVTVEWVIVLDGADPIKVSDPPPCAPINFSGESTLVLPECSNNAGATPRGIGSIYATGALKADMLAYCDADNTFAPNHLAVAIELARRGIEVIAAQRVICEYDTGRPMFVDIVDSDGDKFCDTNCIVLSGRATRFGSMWGWPIDDMVDDAERSMVERMLALLEPHVELCARNDDERRFWDRLVESQNLVSRKCAESGADRVFWDRLRRSFVRTRAFTGAPTVHYNSPWLCHYAPGFRPPEVAKLVDVDANGNRITRRCRPKQIWMRRGEHWHKCLSVESGNVNLDERPHDANGLVVFGDRGWEVEMINDA